MSFPLRYGYCAVGTVIDIGPGVNASWLGKLVFSFSPHGSIAISDTASVKLVPSGISPENAVFAPSIETALSLVQDLQPIMVVWKVL